MTSPQCTAEDCATPTPEAFLCTRHQHTLEKILAELPAQLSDLQRAITKQANAGRGNSGAHTKAAAQPLPLSPAALETFDAARNGLTGWIRHLCESRGLPAPLFRPTGRTSYALASTVAMAHWLLAHLPTIAQDEAAAELLTSMQDLQRALTQAVDNQGKRFVGTCTATILAGQLTADDNGDLTLTATEQRQCGTDLYARPNVKTIACRTCKATVDTATHVRRMVDLAEDHYDTAAGIADVLTEAGTPITSARIRKWAERSRQWLKDARAWKEGDPPLKYEQHPIVSDRNDVRGVPMYRVGDVRERLKVDSARESRRVS